MSEHMLSISEIQQEITRLPDQFTGDFQSVTVTRYGKPVLSVLPYHTHISLLKENQSLREKIAALEAEVEALQETLEVLSDKDLMKSIHQSMQDIADNKGEPLEDVIKELRWKRNAGL